jgi:hypothetical protein
MKLPRPEEKARCPHRESEDTKTRYYNNTLSSRYTPARCRVCPPVLRNVPQRYRRVLLDVVLALNAIYRLPQRF